jgi:hypothetical protein
MDAYANGSVMARENRNERVELEMKIMKYRSMARPGFCGFTSAHSFTLKHTCDQPGQPAGLFV